MGVALTSLAEAIDVHVVKQVLKDCTESRPRCGAHLCAATLTNYTVNISKRFFCNGFQKKTKHPLFFEKSEFLYLT